LRHYRAAQFAVTVTTSNLSDLEPERDESRISTLDPVTANAFASLIAFRRAVEEFGVAHAVSFHSSIRRAENFRQMSADFNQAFPGQPSVTSVHISGAMPSSERELILRHFAARSPSLVTNARCLTEGVDVPEIDCVMFVDPKASTVDIVQAAGRAMRRSPGKTKAYIVLPFVVREGASVDEAANSNEFGLVVAVLRALASQDGRIVDELRAIHRGNAPSTGRVLNFHMSAIVPTEIEAGDFVRAIELQCWGTLKRLAWMPYEEAEAMVRALDLRSQKEFRLWRKGEAPDMPPCPEDMPASPDGAYALNGWKTWGEFFGTGNVSSKFRTFLSFEQAREVVQKLNMKCFEDWFSYRLGKLLGLPKRPENLPSRPDVTYQSQWQGWPDFLGYTLKGDGNWLHFDEARAFACALQLTTAPDMVYKDAGWHSWGDWLGTGNLKNMSSNAPGRLRRNASPPTA
jgi:hypothetical protein